MINGVTLWGAHSRRDSTRLGNACVLIGCSKRCRTVTERAQLAVDHAFAGAIVDGIKYVGRGSRGECFDFCGA